MPSDALQSRIASSGAAPFITYYDEAVGSRVELSAITFGNWVDKTWHLLDELGIEPGARIQVDLVTSAGGHWVTQVWLMAAWQRGCVVSTAVDPGAELVVGGPNTSPTNRPTVVCSLDPLGRPVAQLPAGALDFADVLTQSDLHVAEDVPDNAVIWAPDHTAAQARAQSGRDERVLFASPIQDWSLTLDLLLAPMHGTGSSVVVVGASDQRVAQIAATERAIWHR